MPPLPLYFFSAVGSSCAVIALCVQAGEAWQAAPWLRPLVRTGQMALTLYVAHVVVGMGLNPFPRKARKLLDAEGIAYHYLSYGNYFNHWRPRTALKLWSGWSTFPMVFVKGTLVGGANDLQKLIAQGELARMLA